MRRLRAAGGENGRRLSGVAAAQVNFADSTLNLTYDAAGMDLTAFQKAVADMGYTLILEAADPFKEQAAQQKKGISSLET